MVRFKEYINAIDFFLFFMKIPFQFSDGGTMALFIIMITLSYIYIHTCIHTYDYIYDI